jgi:hypothetical protein
MPTVRYGAPALAMMIAAVIWVVEREPEYKPRSARQDAPFAVQTAPPTNEAQPMPTRNSARVTAVDEKAAAKHDAEPPLPTSHARHSRVCAWLRLAAGSASSYSGSTSSTSSSSSGGSGGGGFSGGGGGGGGVGGV